ncbi:SH3 domain-containing protein [Kurthia sibirica]|uniref:SH3b domain-containing protein n=1 Tax=Kurthia sibirica TaxID=202750 RepID=A0A2U3AP97_9BACL|nr:SH3 domain-containing protein [Kurthia sibirica]PWI26380.1 hypothetical protein DEX24_03320 [Kurthia sibirica]GEK34185.1 hypothetical protein KSI01_17180 [Kurthia sibirica]
MKLTKYVLSLGILTGATMPYVSPIFTANAATQTKAGVVSKDVIVRAESTPKSKKLGVLKKGTKITITKETTYWYQIKFATKTAYVSKDHVNLIATKTTATSDKLITKVKSTKTANASIKSNVYFYAKASSAGKALGILQKGVQIHVNSTSQFGWVEFDHNGKKNYVYKDFVTTKKATTTKPVKPTATKKTPVNTTKKLSYEPLTSKKYSFKANGQNGVLSSANKKAASNFITWKSTINKKATSFYIKETAAGVFYGKSTKTAVKVLPYPFKVDQSYKNGKDSYKVTGANKTIKTAAGTFKSVATVKGDGYVFYIAPKAGIVKMTKSDKTTFELTKIK